MSTLSQCIRSGFPRAAWVAAMLAVTPVAGFAQSAPASSSSTSAPNMGAMPHMDHASLHHASMHHAMRPATPAPAAVPAATDGHSHNPDGTSAAPIKPGSHEADMDMSGMGHAGMDHGHVSEMTENSPPAQDAMSGMNMGAMQGGSPPSDARSPDYSNGVGYGPMQPHLHGNHAVGMLVLDQLETVHGRNGNGQAWEAQAWYGRDEDKLWLRSEGKVSQGKVEDGNVEALWYHAIATYWGSQLGLRHDFGAGPRRDWLALGVQGLAPYGFELEATGYVGSSGRTAVRFRADYELLFTQRLILQPELEFNVYGKNDPARGIGSGLSDAQFGLRLRYEVQREFAPYLGIHWVRRFDTTADYARADRRPVFDQQFVAGFRIWF
ncbi:MAG TPA: copper resistance protein B [Rhodanobacter sp.]|nr:copper resistance protein B [Rhodanobacter sp.]